MATRILTPFEQQNVDYGFSPDVQPSSLSLRRAAPLPTPYKPLRVDQPRSRGGMRGKPYSPAVTTPQSRPQGPEYRLGPRGVEYGPKDLGTVKNDYAQGGDGTVAREAAPAQRGVNIAGGLSRDDIIRRMEMASTGMRGSPSARAAMMGAYADQLKSLDQGELDKNKGNIESDQLAYRGNMDANMQESRGRQEFGNTMGVMIRKGEIDSEAAAAAAEAQANDPYRLAQVENLQSQTLVRRAEAANKSAETEAMLQFKRDSADNAREAMIAKQHPDWTAEQVRSEAQRVALTAGQANSGSTNMDAAKAGMVDELVRAVNMPNTYSDQAMYLDKGQAHFFTDPTARADASTTVDNFTLEDTEGFFPGLRRAFGGQTKTVTMRDKDGKVVKQSMLRDKAEIEKLDAIIKAQQKADYKRRLGE